MANPYAWADQLAKKGWIAVLSGAAVKLAWAIGTFWNRSTQTSKSDAKTLQCITGLGRSRFYEAYAELREAGLVKTSKGSRQALYREYPVTVFKLTQPMPEVPPGYKSARADEYPSRRSRRQKENLSAKPDGYSPADRTYSSGRADKGVRSAGRAERETLRQSRGSSSSSPTDWNPVREQVSKIVSQCLPSASPEIIDLVVKWAEVIARSNGQKVKRTGDGVKAIRGQADLPEQAVREALEQATALWHPTVQEAIRIFDAEVIEVRRLHA